MAPGRYMLPTQASNNISVPSPSVRHLPPDVLKNARYRGHQAAKCYLSLYVPIAPDYVVIINLLADESHEAL